MQVKDYLQALTDENKIRVEKIGSGNWYWSFLSDEKKARERTLRTLNEERERLRGMVTDVDEKIKHALEARAEEGDDIGEREELMRAVTQETKELEAMKGEMEGYRGCDPAILELKAKEVEALKVRAGRWTDNIYILEEYLREMTGGDREAVEGVRRMFYGEEYVEGEGLREL